MDFQAEQFCQVSPHAVGRDSKKKRGNGAKIYLVKLKELQQGKSEALGRRKWVA